MGLIDTAAFAGWAVQFVAVLVMFLLLMRDLIRGENGLTSGLLILSIGVLAMSSLGLFVTATSCEASPGGWIGLLWPNWVYQQWVVNWQTIGVWIINFGIGLIGRAMYLANKKGEQ